jgi:opacity protein-like surface antigen
MFSRSIQLEDRAAIVSRASVSSPFGGTGRRRPTGSIQKIGSTQKKGFAKKLVVLGTVLAAVTITNSQSSAADEALTIYRKAPAPVVDAIYDWSGFYAGVNAGAAWGSYDPATSTALGNHFPDAASVAAINGAGLQSINPQGFTGGGQAGCRQFGRLVVGLEADLDYLHLNGAAKSGAVAYPSGDGSFFTVSSYAHSDWLLTVRSRIGYAANNWLFYATGGVAVTDIKGDFLFFDTSHSAESAAMNTDKIGYAAGAGVEWGVTDRLSLKAEYLRVGFGRTLAGQTFSNIGQPFSQSEALNANIVRLGLNYRFGSSASSGFAAMPVKSPALDAPSLNLSNWELEAGSRVWFSSGRIGAATFDRYRCAASDPCLEVGIQRS